jgi:hypothetical protein
MWREVLRDPSVRRAYLLTKGGVFILAAAATWPLSRVVGPKAWVGLGVFGVLLIALSVAVLSVGERGGERVVEAEDEDDDDEEYQPDRIRLEIEDSLDLHSFPPRDIPAVVEDYLNEAIERGFTEVRLIHGRGIGVQRERVRSLLARHPRVASFHDAPPTRGGWGATVAYLS